MISPVGIFDSGLGGLSVAAEVMRVLPNQSIIYFADNIHVPYGERSLYEIRGFALAITDYLISRGCKAIVMACNISSAMALDAAIAAHPNLPLIGMVRPGAKAAVDLASSAPIGVLATSGTVASEAYPKEILRLSPANKVFQQACPKFVPLVESGQAQSELAQAAAYEYVSPLIAEGCKTIILGCTHYPFLRQAIEQVAGSDVTIVDPAREATSTLNSVLSQKDDAHSDALVQHTFCATGDVTSFASLGSAFLGKTVSLVETPVWGVDLGTNIAHIGELNYATP